MNRAQREALVSNVKESYIYRMKDTLRRSAQVFISKDNIHHK